jgi:hypothetical protein
VDATTEDQISKRIAFKLGRLPEGFELPPEWNVAPTTNAVKRAMRNGVTGGLVDQKVATAIHAATVRVAAKDATLKAEKASSTKKGG